MKTRLLLGAGVFLAACTVRLWGVTTHFWMAGDQIRDWSIVLGPFSTLPLVGPPTHFGGYTLGPAFYWVLWLIRVLVGPWFDNLPHAGGIGQALLQSAADVALLLAIWTRLRSGPVACATIALVVLAPYDLSLSSTIWNPTLGSTFAKFATALALSRWPERSLAGAGATAAVAWCAVQCYTGAVFPALGVFAALVAVPFAKGAHRAAWQRVALTGAIVILLQIPYAAHRAFRDPGRAAMGGVVESVTRVASGSAAPHPLASVRAYADGLSFIQATPWRAPWLIWIVGLAAVVVAVRHRRDPALVAVTVLSQLAALVGYAIWQADLQPYYYLSLMPAAVLTTVVGATALARDRGGRLVAIALCVGALAIAPARVRTASTIHRVPEYGAFVRASRSVVQDGRPIRAILADFLPPPNDPSFIYTILGGRIVRGAPWTAVVAPDGRVEFRPAQ